MKSYLIQGCSMKNENQTGVDGILKVYENNDKLKSVLILIKFS